MPNGSHTCKYNNTEKVGDDNVEFGRGISKKTHPNFQLWLLGVKKNYDYQQTNYLVKK